MEIYIKLFEVLFPVFFVIGIGYYLGKKNPKLDPRFLFDSLGYNIRPTEIQGAFGIHQIKKLEKQNPGTPRGAVSDRSEPGSQPARQPASHSHEYNPQPR